MDSVEEWTTLDEVTDIGEGRVGDILCRLGGEEGLVGGHDDVVEGEQTSQRIVVNDLVALVLVEVRLFFLLHV